MGPVGDFLDIIVLTDNCEGCREATLLEIKVCQGFSRTYAERLASVARTVAMQL